MDSCSPCKKNWSARPIDNSDLWNIEWDDPNWNWTGVWQHQFNDERNGKKNRERETHTEKEINNARRKNAEL